MIYFQCVILRQALHSVIYVDDFIESCPNPREACAIVTGEETEARRGRPAGRPSPGTQPLYRLQDSAPLSVSPQPTKKRTATPRC